MKTIAPGSPQTTSRQDKVIRPCTVIYLLLMALTFVTWVIGKAGLSGLGISLLVLLFALFKGLLIGEYFMGLRTVSGFWRLPVMVWLLLPKKEKRASRKLSSLWKRAKNELDNPQSLIDCLPELVPYRNREQINSIFKNLNFSITNMYFYDSCTIVQL